ncbi:MAG: superoxide dismutase family protein [Caulobacter sp.]|nr:superoxide dismutase family protein [Caulobacter sp.]
MRPLLLAAAVAAIALPAFAQPVSLRVALKGPAGEDLGSAILADAPTGVLLTLDVKGLTPGWHGLHFHEKGDCSSADFKSSGGHVHGAGERVHGLLNPALNEAGDLNNIYVAADGTGHAELFSPWTALTDNDARMNLLDADGSALVIHEKPDDYLTQPIGGAGARVACGVISTK